jgi:hypothetical protein
MQLKYLNKMKREFKLLYFTVIVFLISCSKKSEYTSLQFNQILLSGNGTTENTQHIWQLDSTYLNGINQSLTNIQKQYKTMYYSNGQYADTDKNTGIWEINNINQLKIVINYQLTNQKDSSLYDIMSLNSTKLRLMLKLKNGQIAIYTYKPAN